MQVLSLLWSLSAHCCGFTPLISSVLDQITSTLNQVNLLTFTFLFASTHSLDYNTVFLAFFTFQNHPFKYHIFKLLA